jgi:hypothetical protein
MDTYIHFTVRLLVCGYVLYRIWAVIFSQRLFGVWDKIPVRQKKPVPEPVITVVEEKDLSDIMGRTTVIYLEDPEVAAKVPAHSEKLEPSDFMGEEPDISGDEIESNLSSGSVTEEEIQEEQQRFEDLDIIAPGLDPDFSTGLTYEEMESAVGVLTVATDDEQQIINAAQIIFSIKDTDLYEFFVNQVSNQDNVEKLLSDCLDEDGSPLAVRKPNREIEDMKFFELNKYI